jgi:hypothetical protein
MVGKAYSLLFQNEWAANCRVGLNIPGKVCSLEPTARTRLMSVLSSGGSFASLNLRLKQLRTRQSHRDPAWNRCKFDFGIELSGYDTLVAADF